MQSRPLVAKRKAYVETIVGVSKCACVCHVSHLPSYPLFTGRHLPTVKTMRAGFLITAAKVWAAAKLLQLSGRLRQARAVLQGFKAFSVQNTPK